MKIGIVGATGLVGSYLLPFLQGKGFEVFAFNRLKLEPIPCDAVINLAGEAIAEGRWTAKKKQHILESRVEITRQIVEKLQPQCLISASAVGYYGHRPQTLLDESSPKGTGFLSDVCQAWEKEAFQARGRVACLRFGVILSNRGGAYDKLKQPFRFGSGEHYISWIHLHDVVRAIFWILTHESLDGAINVCSPHPLTQRQFVETINGRSFPLPAPLIKWVFGEKGEGLLLQDTRVHPSRLLHSGFTFTYPTLRDALIEL
ncbi:MAG: TIGR01777 family oxidoreductase [Simkaniaceae bacterium]|nr:TIGR01777 family oxidoreductase [Simkaniaceae bacterium]